MLTSAQIGNVSASVRCCHLKKRGNCLAPAGAPLREGKNSGINPGCSPAQTIKMNNPGLRATMVTRGREKVNADIGRTALRPRNCRAATLHLRPPGLPCSARTPGSRTGGGTVTALRQFHPQPFSQHRRRPLQRGQGNRWIGGHPVGGGGLHIERIPSPFIPPSAVARSRKQLPPAQFGTPRRLGYNDAVCGWGCG